MKWKSTLLRIVLIVAIVMLLGVTAQAEEVNENGESIVHFEDENLEIAIRAALQIFEEEITQSDLSEIESLNDFNAPDKITNLSGLEYATNLTYLYLGNSNVTDLSPIAPLTKLERLDIFNSDLADLSGLSGLHNLRTLNLMGNKITDLSPISQLTNLEELVLYDNQITDLTGLKGLVNLTSLVLEDNQVSDLSPISNLSQLLYLSLSNNNIETIQPLKKLTNLINLDIAKNKISDISLLNNLSKLEYVNIEKNQININQGSSSYLTIQSLINRGVIVIHDDMIQLLTKKVSKNAISVEWNISKSFLNYPHFEIRLLLDGEIAKVYNDLKTISYTFNNLKEGQEYEIELQVIYATENMGNMIPTIINVKAEDVKTKKKAVVKPSIGGNIATITNYDALNTVAYGGILEIDVQDFEDKQIQLKLTANQIAILQESNASIEINRGDTSIIIPASLLGDGIDVSISMTKLEAVEGSVSSVYDFKIETEDGFISSFNEAVTLIFNVDQSLVKDESKLNVWYYNPITEEWEYIGGQYSDGQVIAETDHFSTFTVFEREEPVNPIVENEDVNEDKKTGDNGEEGDRLPNTSTPMLTLLLIGSLLILSAILLTTIQRRRKLV